MRTNEYKNTDTTKIFYFLNFADKLIQPLKNQLKLVGDNEAIRAFIMYQWEVDLSFAICPIVTKEFSLKDDNSKFIHVGYGKTHDPFDGKDLNDHKRRYYSGILQFKAPLKGEPNNSNVFYIPVLMSKFAEKMMVPPENLPMTGYESKPVEGNSGGPFFDDDDNIFGVLRNGNQESLDVPIYDDFGEFVRMGREEVDCSGINPISPLIYDTMKKVIGRMKVLFTKKNDVNQLPYNDQEIDKIFTEALEKMVNKDGADIVRQRYKDFMKSYKPK